MYKPKVIKEFYEVVELDGRIEIHLKHIAEVREKINYFEGQLNNANNIMCIRGSTQSDIESARATYRNATKQKSLAHETYRNLNNSEAQKQYEAENILDLTEKNKQLINEIFKLRKKTKHPLSRLEELKKTLIDLDNQLDVLVDANEELRGSQEAFEEGKLEARLTGNRKGLDSLRVRFEDAKRSLAEAQKDLSGGNEYRKQRERLFERASKFKHILAGVSVEIKQKEVEFYMNSSLIRQIRYQVILNDLLECLKLMVAYDDMAEGKSAIGLDLVVHLGTKGITKPTANGPCESHVILSGLLDNLGEEKARIKAEFEKDIADSVL